MLNEIDISDKICFKSMEEYDFIKSLSEDEIQMYSEVTCIVHGKSQQSWCHKIIKKVQQFLSTNALPLFLIISVIIGALVPQIGIAIDHKGTTEVCLVILFLYSGLYLSTSSIIEALKAYRAVIWGTLSILCVTSVIGVQLTSLMSFHSPLNLITNTSIWVHRNLTSQTQLLGNDTVIHNIDSFRTGLMVYLSSPCPVPIGILMVTQINGNAALAVMLTVLTNIVGIFTTPLILKWILFTGSQIKLDLSSLLLDLSLCLVLPILVGKSLRFVKFVKTFISNPSCKFFLMLCSITGLSIIVLIQVSKSSSAGGLQKLTFVNTLVIIGWALAVHFILLLLNGIMSWVLRLERKQLKCIVILASQKNVVISSAVLIFIPIEFGDRGLMAIAIVVAHLSILLFDSLLIPIWLYIEKKYAFCSVPNNNLRKMNI